MPEMELERRGAAAPIAQLPLGSRGGFVVEIFVQVAKTEAGCCICQRPTPSGASRVTFKVKMPDELDDLGNWVPSKQPYRRYHVHPGCLTKPMRSEVKRAARDCWDCGLPPKVDPDGRPLEVWNFAFTTSRFASAPLCPRCAEKPKWKACGNCEVLFPHWMVSYGEAPNRPSKSLQWSISIHDGPRQEVGNWCSYCAERYGVLTQEDMKAQADEFEEVRRRIMQQGIFDE